jgi:hypothetical protein
MIYKHQRNINDDGNKGEESHEEKRNQVIDSRCE